MGMTKRMRVAALDPLFFRDGKPFTMGSDHVTTSQFPPSPGVVYGALRTLFFAHHSLLFARLKKTNAWGQKGVDPTAVLRLRGLYLKRGNELLVPLPLDCVREVREKGQKDEAPTAILARRRVEGISNYPLPQVLVSPFSDDRRVEPVEQALCTATDFVKYLTGASRRGPVPVQLRSSRSPSLVVTEYKVGIGRSPATGHVREGMLYRAGMVRLHPDVSLVVDYEADKSAPNNAPFVLPERGVLRLGGEGRTAVFTHEEPTAWPAPEVDPRAFKVVLLTPALFANGWHPGWLRIEAEKGYVGTFRGVTVELLAAAVGRYVNVGGFDMSKGRPKPMWRAVPAGSVYYFSAQPPATSTDVVEAFHCVSLSDFRQEEGFGLAVVAREPS